MTSLNPSILVKGGEWTASEVRERDNVSDEIDIKIYPLVKNYSTTNVIEKIHSKKTWKKIATTLSYMKSRCYLTKWEKQALIVEKRNG